MLHRRLIFRQRAFYRQQQALGLLVAGTGEVGKALVELLDLFVDHRMHRLAIFRPRIERDAEFGTAENDHVLIGLRGRQRPLGRRAHVVGALLERGHRRDAEPTDADRDSGQQQDDREDFGDDLDAREQGHG